MTDASAQSVVLDGGGQSLSVRQWTSLAVLLTGTFVTVLDNFIVLVAVPDIRSNLGASFADAEFVVAGYSLTFAAGMITSGRLGDRFGRRRLFLIGFAAFTVTSALCGLAGSPRVLIASRIAQGVAAATLTPQVFAIIRVTFADTRQRATALASMGVVIGMASVLGQIVGGVIIAANLGGLSWRPIFLINVPIGISVILAAAYLLPESRPAAQSKLDLVGAILSAMGLGLFLFPIVEGREDGWPAWSFVMLGASVAVLSAFAVHQHAKTIRRTSPLLDTSLFRIKAFTVGLVLVLLFYATLTPLFLCFTYLVQIGFGQSPSEAALDFSPLAASFALASFIAGRLSRKRPRSVLISGATIVAIGSVSAYAICAWVPSVSPAYLAPSLAVLGAGQGLFATTVLNVVLSGIPDDHAGAASGVLTTMQRAGSALGVAGLQIPFFATLSHGEASGMSHAAAYVAAFASVAMCVAVMAVAVLGLLLLLPQQEGAAVKGMRHDAR